MLQNKSQTFNDGVVRIFTVTNNAENGDMPSEGISLKQSLRYKERTVGMSRFFAALQANIKVDYVLRCPQIRSVSTQDVAIPNDGKQYRIVQIQYPKDVEPRVMDLTLEEVTAEYAIV